MDSNVDTVFKVLVLSTGLACAIKYLAPQIPIPPTSTNALIAVLLPSLLVAIALAWRIRAEG